jgi:hypothetical protein
MGEQESGFRKTGKTQQLGVIVPEPQETPIEAEPADRNAVQRRILEASEPEKKDQDK